MALRLLLVLLCAGPWLAEAHPARTSALLIDVEHDSLRLELQMPQELLDRALLLPPDTTEEGLSAALRDYVGQHVWIHGADGAPLPVLIGRSSRASLDGIPHVITELEAAGHDLRRFTVRADPILHAVTSHRVFVSIRRDFASGLLAQGEADAEPVGVLRAGQEQLEVDRGRGSPWRGAWAVLGLGMQHIAEGSDHLLFLLTLLLVAPLLARGGRWQADPSLRAPLWRILKIVSAFTLGHSLTLAWAALGSWHVPSRPVEVLVAVSILISAANALRPLFPRREPWIAAAFGLVHGLAFAGSFAELGYDAHTRVLTLLAFNLGIEVMQLVSVVWVLPWLLLLRATPWMDGIRWAGASFAGIAAVAWILERCFDWHNPLEAPVEAAFAHAPWGVTVLAALACAVTLRRRRATRAPIPPQH